MKCRIKEKTKKGPVIGFSDRRYAQIRGQPIPRRWVSARYLDTETGDMFFALSGGFCWPGERPGFALVLGIKEVSDGSRPLFKVLDEIEEKNITDLVGGAFKLWQKWGRNCATVPWQWYGDPEIGFNQFLIQFGKERGQSYHLIHPPHWEEKDAFEIYFKTIYAVARQSRLYVGQNHRLRAAMDLISDRQAYRDSLEDHPAIAALGMVLTWMVEYEPWKLDDDGMDSISHIPTIAGDKGKTLQESDEFQYLGQDDDVEEYKVEPPDKKELISTI